MLELILRVLRYDHQRDLKRKRSNIVLWRNKCENEPDFASRPYFAHSLYGILDLYKLISSYVGLPLSTFAIAAERNCWIKTLSNALLRVSVGNWGSTKLTSQKIAKAFMSSN